MKYFFTQKLSWYVVNSFPATHSDIIYSRSTMFVQLLHLMPLINVQSYSNVFPHSTFNWVGIDGTQVLCHMTPGTARRILRRSHNLTGSHSGHVHCPSNRWRRKQRHCQSQSDQNCFSRYADANGIAFRISNLQTFLYLCSGMATAEEGLYLK